MQKTVRFIREDIRNYWHERLKVGIGQCCVMSQVGKRLFKKSCESAGNFIKPAGGIDRLADIIQPSNIIHQFDTLAPKAKSADRLYTDLKTRLGGNKIILEVHEINDETK